METDVFDWFVERHEVENLPKCMDHYVEGKIKPNGVELKEGSDIGSPYKGILWAVVMSPDVFDDPKKLQIIVDPDAHSQPRIIRGKEDAFRFIDEYADEDGAFLHDPFKQRAMHIHEFKNEIKTEEPLLSYIPPKFFFYDERNWDGQPIKLGTKTRMAIKLPHVRDTTQLEKYLKGIDLKYGAFKEAASREDFMRQVYDMLHTTERLAGEDSARLISDTFQIKRSAYGTQMGIDTYLPFGPGKVTHMTINGLVQEYFPVGKQNGDGFREGPMTRGAYREWKRADGKFYRLTASKPAYHTEDSYKPPNTAQKAGVSEEAELVTV